MADKRSVASPPDDGGHTGSKTVPEQTMVEDDGRRAPELNRDRSKVVDRGEIGLLPILISGTIFVVFLVLILFMPR